MDVSIFFLNRTRFWGWILLPLALRLALTAAFAYLARQPVEELARLKGYQQAIEVLEKEKGDCLAAMEPFGESSVMPFQGQFLTDISRYSRSAAVKTKPSSSVEEVEGTRLVMNTFDVSGTSPSLHEFSVFMDLMMQLPRAAVVQMNLRSDVGRGEDSGEVESVDFDVQFVRVELEEDRK